MQEVGFGMSYNSYFFSHEKKVMISLVSYDKSSFVEFLSKTGLIPRPYSFSFSFSPGNKVSLLPY